MSANMSEIDISILKISFMMSAVDGHVDQSEYDRFMELARHVDGFREEQALAALDEAKKRLRDDAMLILQLYDGWNLEALETLIGQGDSTLQLCEYVMPFR